ncbi:AraC family ligand binding domain-containing protein [Aureisphaera sp. CAU 1614]|uniref:AraC family ligand binding domain-containing protein n=1 Tax=Halomarinibacterium sedimenti TaxID=2857106 RepID=A0A9X1JXW1_9FLAO|nr:cupin domain-containing protein [Halomarinibacterium sedimenti]MBW2936932.1 AraC family ligand binding domain-containing protein [Halomarinibacterium sedimenti]
MSDFYKIDTTISNTKFEGLSIQKLWKQEHAEILYISLEKGSIFPKHDAPRNAFLQMLEGQIVFYIAEKEYMIKENESFQFPAKELHSVAAIQNSKFLIIR